MIDSKVLEQLKEEGYSVHKRMDEKCLKRRNEIYGWILDYAGHIRYMYSKKHGNYPYIYCYEQYAQDKTRNAMKKMYGNLNYQDIPDEQWPEVKEKLIKVAKDYMDYKIQKQMVG